MEILTSNPKVSNLEHFSQQIYRGELSSDHFKKGRTALEEKIEKLRKPEFHANWQLYTLGIALLVLIVETGASILM